MKRISVGLIEASLLTLDEINAFTCNNVKALKLVHYNHGVGLEIILSFLSQFNWIKYNNTSYFEITEAGEYIISQFNPDGISHGLWQEILKSYIFTCNPAWTSRIPSGRQEAFIFMSKDEQRCFFEAGLMETPPGDKIIKWWDNVSEEIRRNNNLDAEETGRDGERLTVKYEKKRTNKQPVWESIETNKVGYDIISTINKDSDLQLLIEVKSSKLPISTAHMIISKNEWKIANLPNNISSYLFYVWDLHKDIMLAKLSVSDISPHIPISQGAGDWQSVEIPFDSFSNKFTTQKELN